MGAATLAGADRPDPSRSVAEAAALEAALRAGRNRCRHGARFKAGWRISLRQRYRGLLRVDAGACFTLARFRLDRGARLRLAPAMGRLHDDAIRTQSRARRPPCGVFAFPESALVKQRPVPRSELCHQADAALTHPVSRQWKGYWQRSVSLRQRG